MKLQTLGLILRTSLPLLGASLLLPACGGKGDGGSDGTEGMGGARGVANVACETDADCNDFLYCNGEEECVQGTCRQGAPIDCDDGIDCTSDRCREDLQSCQSVPPDVDGDGHADARCDGQDGSSLGDDCDDEDPNRFPGNPELCDPDNRDEDCNPSTFGSQDADQDGFLDGKCCNEQADGELLCGDDCDDRKTNVNPAATEVCDFLDNNCDGKTDEGVSVTMYQDKDHDGRGDDDAGAVKSCAGAVGFSLVDGDCDDSDPEVFEGELEIGDHKDNNCNGVADEVQEQAPWYLDVDGDGYGDPESTPVLSCYRVAGRVLSRNDCNDAAKKVNPNATEICDGLDNDCNGAADFKLAGVNNFEDDDGDGAADSECGGPDCDDEDPRTSEGAEEVCDRIDNDCDGEVDEQTVQNIWYIDEDGDGWGVVLGSALASCDPIPNRASNFGDCDDGNRDVKPGVTEICDGIDQDCDGLIDEGAEVHCDLDNALAACRFGECGIFSCFPGFADADHNPANGCEAAVNPDDLLTTTPCIYDVDCNDANLCNGIETCLGGFCRLGTSINCDAGPSVIQGNMVISTGLDVKALEGIDTITGDLVINGTLLSSLVGLESLRVIGGNLFVQGNSNLVRLSGSALSNLEIVGGGIYVESNPNLISVSLPSLVSANALNIVSNDKLEVVGGFPHLVNIDQLLHIFDNSQLTKIEGFEGLGRIGGGYEQSGGGCGGEGGLEIEYNTLLETIDAFEALGDVGGDLCVLDNYELRHIAFPQLRGVGQSFAVSGIYSVSDIDMPTLQAVGKEISISASSGEGGPSAVETISMPALMGVGGELSIQGGVPTIEAVDLGSLKDANGISIDFSGDADALTTFDLSSLEKATYISIDYSTTTAGVPVWAFPSLTDVAGDLNLSLSGEVTAVQLPLLAQANAINISVYANNNLQRLMLPALTMVGSDLYLYADGGPLNRVQLGELATVGGNLYLGTSTSVLDISKLMTVGVPSNNGSIGVYVSPFDVCPDLARLLAGGHSGPVDDGGQCGAQTLL